MAQSPSDALSLAWQHCDGMRAASPLVHNITNHVVMNITANALLAAGASPIMAHAACEMDEITALASALVLNIGTLSPEWVSSMFLAGRAAQRKGIPIVLDPVGAGASRYRTQTALNLLHELRPAILRGNASEIIALAGENTPSRGVDSAAAVMAALDAARSLAGQFSCTVVVSGPVDLVVSREHSFKISGGHELMPRITGMGCTASALVAAHAATAPSPTLGAVAGMVMMAAAGGHAAGRIGGEGGPASFQIAFLDALYTFSQAHVRAHAAVEALA